MTQNQIAFFKANEERRHNVHSERAGYQQAAAALSQAETAKIAAAETERSHRESEKINWWNAQELQRHNLQGEGVATFNAVTEARYKSAVAQAQLRNAISSERNAATAERNAATSERAVSVQENGLAETIRHNGIFEAETQRHNQAAEALERARLAEQRYATNTSRAIASEQIGLGYSQLRETERSNRSRESQQLASLNEQIRTNQAREAETHRANVYAEKQRNTQMRETSRSNWAKETLERERNESYRLMANAKSFDTASSIARDFVGLIGGAF